MRSQKNIFYKSQREDYNYHEPAEWQKGMPGGYYHGPAERQRGKQFEEMKKFFGGFVYESGSDRRKARDCLVEILHTAVWKYSVPAAL